MVAQNKKYSGNNSAEALKAFDDRMTNLVEQQKAIAADLSALKEEINSAGFSHRTLKKVATAKIAANNGKPKALQDLREESGDLPSIWSILAPEETPQAEDSEAIPAFLDRRQKVEAA